MEILSLIWIDFALIYSLVVYNTTQKARLERKHSMGHQLQFTTTKMEVKVSFSWKLSLCENHCTHLQSDPEYCCYIVDSKAEGTKNVLKDMLVSSFAMLTQFHKRFLSPEGIVAKDLCLIVSKGKHNNPSSDTVSRSNFHNNDHFAKIRNYLVIKHILQTNSESTSNQGQILFSLVFYLFTYLGHSWTYQWSTRELSKNTIVILRRK